MPDTNITRSYEYVRITLNVDLFTRFMQSFDYQFL
ncbi:hypothetical protein Echvi_2546 [Echinicola vietnamensis DSM 17526]|uniref:Uncharacterized protein n=1 Tax=Echinicola vietnamensis (strain DSM 17526 / LMG 23754 / KMM 6221) TaxID=926556 RepID=L0FZQ6_ECHVK|nr:hypothetical protein Echvi_2546 [Echinicola vietnamensis DSM 17526]